MPAPVMESSSSRPPHPPLVRSYSFGGRATGAKPGLLRRAQNLLSVPLPTMNELHEDALVAEDTSGSGTRTRPSAERRKSDGSFGQSFKKYVDNVVARAPSLKKRHSLTHSDSEASRPISLKRATSAALKRRSQPPPTPQQLPAPGQFPAPHDPAMPDTFEVPTVIREGTQMTKVSSKHIKTNVYRIDPHRGLILWPSRKAGMIPIEGIKEIRTGADARNYREQFKIAHDAERRWLTIVYSVDNKYKTLHLIAQTPDIFTMWEVSLRALHSVRLQLMDGLDHSDLRQRVWERQHWHASDHSGDAKLDLNEVEGLCCRLNIFSSRADLARRFKEADVEGRGYLDFAAFQRFVKLLKKRPEIERLFSKISNEDGVFDFKDFVQFMRDCQHSSLSENELRRIFDKFADTNAAGEVIVSPPQSPSKLPVQFALPIITNNMHGNAVSDLSASPTHDPSPSLLSVPPPPPAAAVQSLGSAAHTLTTSGDTPPATTSAAAATPAAPTPAPASAAPKPETAVLPPAAQATPAAAAAVAPGAPPNGTAASSSRPPSRPPSPNPPNRHVTDPFPQANSAKSRPLDLPPTESSPHIPSSVTRPNKPTQLPPVPPGQRTPGSTPTLWSVAAFTTFLISSENSAFSDQHGKIWQDMNRPLAEYYVASSHNTYLVGNQLVGSSTFEGYIRALLNGARSVELDIFDGETEPVVYHGRTLTGRVTVRQVCEAIKKYGFVVSPYPIIISAEVHCSVVMQDMLAKILREVFGPALVTDRLDGVPVSTMGIASAEAPSIELLPSPEDLKYRVLLKTKNLFLAKRDELAADAEEEAAEEAESSVTSVSEESSASETERLKELKEFGKKTIGKLVLGARGKSKRDNGLNAKPPAGASSGEVAQPKTTRNHRVPHHAATLPPMPSQPAMPKPEIAKMSQELAKLLVYTVGVKCRGINKKEEYATEQMFSLSERAANKYLKQGMMDLVKHNKTHAVRIYPNGTRMNSSNYEPHRFWAAGAQLVALNWQTFDLGYKLNHAMFQRNGRAGYVLKPLALRVVDKILLQRKTNHILDVTVISAQQLPRPRDSDGLEVDDKQIVDPYIEVSVHMPDWTHSPFAPGGGGEGTLRARTAAARTNVVKNNGFNPVWQETLSLAYDVVGDMRDLVFVRFEVYDEADDEEPLAEYTIGLGSLQHGYRHLPLLDTQLQQYLFSTLFVQIGTRNV